MIKDHVFQTIQDLCEYYFDQLTQHIDKEDFSSYDEFHAHIIDVIKLKAPFLDEELNLLSYTYYLWNHNEEEMDDDYL